MKGIQHGKIDMQVMMPMAETHIKPCRSHRNRSCSMFFGVILAIIWFFGTVYLCVDSLKRSGDYKLVTAGPLFGKMGSYTGSSWIKPETLSKIVAAETKFARCDVHTVRTEDGSIIKDWLFMEERNAVNVIVINEQGKFVIFRQKKYGIEGKTLSPVGGFIDDKETAYLAAKREVKEELGLGSPLDANESNPTSSVESLDDPDWIYLGMYRTMINRGGGFVSLFLLKNAVPLLPNGGTERYKGIGDDESQELLLLTKEEILTEITKANFKEVKWTAALALSILHLENIIPPSDFKS